MLQESQGFIHPTPLSTVHQALKLGGVLRQLRGWQVEGKSNQPTSPQGSTARDTRSTRACWREAGRASWRRRGAVRGVERGGGTGGLPSRDVCAGAAAPGPPGQLPSRQEQAKKGATLVLGTGKSPLARTWGLSVQRPSGSPCQPVTRGQLWRWPSSLHRPWAC